VNFRTKGAASRRLLSQVVQFSLFGAAIFCLLSLSLRHAAAKQDTQVEFTVHEWGTFTSIAGPDGLAMDWLPLTGSTDLPNFVEHFRDAHFKGGLRGTIRMETPVLYFYSPRETNVFVNVGFSKGLITEWYPHGGSVNSGFDNHALSLGQMKSPGSISWNSLRINPNAANDFPSDDSVNHYYAARKTAATPLEVSTRAGVQREKFLFYRGVATFLPPLTATLNSDDGVELQSHSSAEIPGVILLERRGTQLGYRVLGALRDQAALAPPALDGSVESLSSTLEGMLVTQGLNPDEAHAMLETWKDSWFEEGSRVIYIVPRPFTDSMLPLSIKPTPASVTRVFVGRLELVTRATQQAVEHAFASNDSATLAKYKRFLEPIVRTMYEQASDSRRKELLLGYLNTAASMAYAAQ
jgi:hypothetical protein